MSCDLEQTQVCLYGHEENDHKTLLNNVARPGSPSTSEKETLTTKIVKWLDAARPVTAEARPEPTWSDRAPA